MQNESASSNHKLHSTATAAAEYSDAATISAADENSSFVDNFTLSDPFLSPTPPNHHASASASSFYSSFFSQPSTSPTETSFDDLEGIAIERRLHQASYLLEYQQLYNRYTLCLAQLQESLKELDALRHENNALRLANADLAHRLSLLSQATIQNCLLSDFSRLGIGNSHVAASEPPPRMAITPPPSVVGNHNRLERRNMERSSLPKSISVRSSGYLKLKPNSESGPSHNSSRRRVKSSHSDSQKVCIPDGKSEQEALEFEVYNQGMQKTELCNKWQQTSACPYGDNCQFAHGINELRPVIRHPRYKTEACRMVLAGDVCPYGHRCHFRHSLTHQERLIAYWARDSFVH